MTSTTKYPRSKHKNGNTTEYKTDISVLSFSNFLVKLPTYQNTIITPGFSYYPIVSTRHFQIASIPFVIVITIIIIQSFPNLVLFRCLYRKLPPPAVPLYRRKNSSDLPASNFKPRLKSFRPRRI